MWIAYELKIGDWRKMKYPNLYMAIETLDDKIRDQTLVDPRTYAAEFERQVLLDMIEDRLNREGRAGILAVYQLIRRGYSWQEVADRLDFPSADVVKRRFYRWIKKKAART
jgi:hypothetical protein